MFEFLGILDNANAPQRVRVRKGIGDDNGLRNLKGPARNIFEQGFGRLPRQMRGEFKELVFGRDEDVIHPIFRHADGEQVFLG